MKIFSKSRHVEKDEWRNGSSELLLHMVKSMDKIIKIVIEELKEEKYDYVIYDNNFAVGWIIAEALHLPKISSCTTFAVTKKLFNALMNNHNEGDKNHLFIKKLRIF